MATAAATAGMPAPATTKPLVLTADSMRLPSSWKHEAILTVLKVATGVSIWYAIRALWVWSTQEMKLSDFHLFVTVPILLHFCIYWALGLVAAYFDISQTPASLYKYKIQPKHVVGVSGHVRAATVVLRNQMLIAAPLQLLLYPWAKHVGISTDPTPPSGLVVMKDVLLCILILEPLFYYSHRLMHWGPFYKHVHKLHHDFRAPIAIAAEYAHPIEFLLSNVGPVVIGPMVIGCHTVSMWLWVALAIISTMHSHCGYEFPLTPFKPTSAHDYHHSSFGSIYGAIGLCDWLHGTDKPYYSALARRANVAAAAATTAAAINTQASAAAATSSAATAAWQVTAEEDAVPDKQA